MTGPTIHTILLSSSPAKIEQTDQLIDDIVYELYGLIDEEVEIVEEAVGE